MEPFIPPRFNLALHWTVDATLPLLMKTGLNIDSVEISEDDRRRARELRKDRLVLYMNHPTTAEAAVAYHLGNLMGARFHYMASREVFDWLGGMMGVMLQGLGAFSVMPGSDDRDSIRMARSLLCEPSGKLVVFPEGDYPTGSHNRLEPFQPDSVHLAFRAVKDLRRGGDPEEDIELLPAFVRHVLSGSRQDIVQELETSVRRLESKLGERSGGSIPERLGALRLRILQKGEDELGLAPTADAPSDRMTRLEHAFLDRVAARHTVQDYPHSESAAEKLRFLLAVIERRRVNFPDPRLPEMNGEELNRALSECRRSSVLAGLSEESPDFTTAEAVMERIQRMEEYLSGSSRPRSSRAVLRLGVPLRTSQFFETYERSRKVGLAELTERLTVEMQMLLDQTRVLCTRLD